MATDSKGRPTLRQVIKSGTAVEIYVMTHNIVWILLCKADDQKVLDSGDSRNFEIVQQTAKK
jgi:hypothetical protein